MYSSRCSGRARLSGPVTVASMAATETEGGVDQRQPLPGEKGLRDETCPLPGRARGLLGMPPIAGGSGRGRVPQRHWRCQRNLSDFTVPYSGPRSGMARRSYAMLSNYWAGSPKRPRMAKGKVRKYHHTLRY